ncbi:HAMP domain-containing histidine kinase [Synechococcus sp. CB0101]|uniref:sensor histidine kinase n=1 Tax=Synechococcus sp. CB0101 TaxID=232348 RepID=UPI0002002887|nr:HAMP domain-containing sensor histidine kinase [Synechococcus sp. CB0101]QCH15364.1 HAMP domain-containing histidine kinase [Synechococcus sp. CB0101]
MSRSKPTKGKANPSLYWSLTQWISAAIVVSAGLEFEISRRIVEQINHVMLKEEGTEALEDYSKTLQKAWREKPDQTLTSLLDSTFSTSHVTPVLINGANVSSPTKTRTELSDAEITEIRKTLLNDEDQFIVGRDTGLGLAAAAQQLTLEANGQNKQVQLVVVLRWPLLKSLRELQWFEFQSRAITLIITLLASGLLLYALLEPLRRLNQKTRELTSEQLPDARVDADGAPREIHELITSYNDSLDRLNTEYERQQLFASTVSHEFKTPLTVIRGYIESILIRSTNLTEREASKLETAKQEVDRLNQLVSDLLDLSRYDHNTLKLRNEPFSPHAELSTTANHLRDMHPDRVSAHISEDIQALMASGDAGRYAQIIRNLTENALKYSPADTKVEIRGFRRENTIVAEVADQGPGIAPEHQTRIFERFYRIDEHRTLTQKSSSGLGLAIVKSLADSMGATVGVHSTVGHGSTFWLAIGIISPANNAP